MTFSSGDKNSNKAIVSEVSALRQAYLDSDMSDNGPVKNLRKRVAFSVEDSYIINGSMVYIVTQSWDGIPVLGYDITAYVSPESGEISSMSGKLLISFSNDMGISKFPTSTIPKDKEGSLCIWTGSMGFKPVGCLVYSSPDKDNGMTVKSAETGAVLIGND